MWSHTHSSEVSKLEVRMDLALKPTYATIEFMGASDTVQARSFWHHRGFRDVTPQLRGKFPKQTFRKSVPANEFAGYHAALLHLHGPQTASWICLSGHHGRIDDECVTVDHGDDWSLHYNEEDDVGFFNHHFHEHEWVGKGTHDNSLFIYSTSKVEPHSRTGAIFGAPFRKNEYCKGLILSACNTLAYRASRKWLHDTFPNAVVFGFTSTTRFGANNICPIMGHWEKKVKGVFQNEPDFWREPMEWLKGQGRTLDEQMEIVMNSLNNKYRKLAKRGRDFAMKVGDHIYIQGKDKKVKKLNYDFKWS